MSDVKRAALLGLASLAAGALIAAGARAWLDGSGKSGEAPVSDRFRDVAARLGLETRHRALPPCGFNAAGAAWGDVNGNGRLDLFLPQQEGLSELWIQRPSGHLVERGEARGVATAGIATSAAFADYDNDGDQDLYVGAVGADSLLENDGEGRFTRRELSLEAEGSDPLAPRPEDSTPAMAVSWIDFDGDGLLDLHVAMGNNCLSDPPPAPNRLLRNLGQGRFRDVSELLPEASQGLTLDAIWLDYDGDRNPDLYLGNDNLGDEGNQANALLANNGRGFKDVSSSTGAGISRSTMGVAAGDVSGNGLIDLALSDIGREALLVQVEPGRFEERAEERGFGRERVASGEESITWGIALADLDNDGDLDAYAAAGPLGLDPGRQDDALYEADGQGRFHRFDVAAPGPGRSVVPADLDRDGDVDLLVAQINRRPLLLENRGRPDGHWLELRLVGRRSARDACGAVVTLVAGSRSQLRLLECRGGDKVLHFGLGRAERVRRLRVLWPSGLTQKVGSLSADRLWTIAEGRDPR